MTSMDKFPPFSPHHSRQSLRYPFIWILSLGVLVFVLTFLSLQSQLGWESESSSIVPVHAEETLQKCRLLNVKPSPPLDFNLRTQSDRFEAGTKPTLIRNATIWTGRVSGLEILKADILLDKGLIKIVGNIKQSDIAAYKDLVTLEAAGAWASPGLVDLHSHLGVDSSPSLRGTRDTNSIKGLVLPWMRSLDGLNTHDDAYRLSISGGVTTAVVLPGSADAIGGQAFPIKLRPTEERTPSSMLLEPPYSLNGTEVDPSLAPRWRQMKHACGENPSRVYSGTRMDTIWAFRQGYDTARKIKVSQDEYCNKALAGRWTNLGPFPEDLQWEALVDVLRGRVKVHTHCYEAVDLDDLVRLSNEFKFSIAAFHHAHETYLVPDLLKEAYGQPPAAAIFATNARYKREAYRGSEFAARILADEGLQVVMKSDHPVLNSRYLLYEAQQAHYYGLGGNLALAAVTTTPAIVMGQDHRIGYVKEGYDADIVLWDSHPLALGATPKQVYIDGIPQFAHPYTVDKPDALQRAPHTPDFDSEAAAAIEYDGLPPLALENATSNLVIFLNVSSIFLRDGKIIREVFSTSLDSGVVVVDSGSVTCVGTPTNCLQNPFQDVEYINLEGGSISPALISFGSPLGLQDIQGEVSTYDGYVFDPLQSTAADIVGGDFSIVRAVDGLQFSGRDALLAYRAGVTSGVVAPKYNGFFSGFSTAFSTGAVHKLQRGALIQEVTALHIHVGHSGTSTPSISTQISTLRRLLLGNDSKHLDRQFQDVVDGKLPLVIEVHNADIMASLISLKAEVETKTGKTIRVTFTGASEAHLLAKEIASANIGVILRPSRPFPATWESKRILPGPPLTQQNALSALLAENILVGIGIKEQWSARSTRFDIAWAALEANVNISRSQALALASVNLEALLGVNTPQTDLVATRGGSLLDFESKIVGVVSPTRGVVNLF